MVSVILPSYDPTDKLEQTVNALVAEGFDDIIIINDGSSENCRYHFEKAAENPCVTLLTHDKNMGKGKALKTGFEYFIKNRSDKAGVVTTDDDMQHDCKDIRLCAEEMERTGIAVLGARSFKNNNVPFASRLGNAISTFTFRFICGIKITDTQTGLRAIPTGYLPILTDVRGERFEYETNMLLEMKQRGLQIKEIPIKTIYEENHTSHFNPFKDALKIYAVILKYVISSISASVIDLVIFTLLNMLLPENMEEWVRIFTATAAARVVSSATNYTINRKKVFKSRINVKSSLLKYYVVAVCQAALSYSLVYTVTYALGTTQSIWQTLYKMIVDIILFFLCFIVQREWVFKEKKSGEK